MIRVSKISLKIDIELRDINFYLYFFIYIWTGFMATENVFRNVVNQTDSGNYCFILMHTANWIFQRMPENNIDPLDHPEL